MHDFTTVGVSQTDTTREQYRRIYERLARWTVAASVAPAAGTPSPQQIAATFLEHEPSWSDKTARLYRAALTATFTALDTPDGHEAIELVHHRHDDGEWRLQVAERIKAERRRRRRIRPLTSAQKAKRFSRDDARELMDALAASRSQWAEPTRIWFMAAALTGLRPTEWRHASLGLDEAGRPVLQVRNAKNTNGRAHGPVRTLVIEDLTQAQHEAVRKQVDLARSYDGLGAVAFDHYYEECRRLLRNVADRLWPRRLKHPTLYTARHMFAADAKSVFGKVEVAAMMGHASTETAGTHYAPRWSGRGALSVSPAQADVSAVAGLNPTADPPVPPQAPQPGPAAEDA